MQEIIRGQTVKFLLDSAMVGKCDFSGITTEWPGIIDTLQHQQPKVCARESYFPVTSFHSFMITFSFMACDQPHLVMFSWPTTPLSQKNDISSSSFLDFHSVLVRFSGLLWVCCGDDVYDFFLIIQKILAKHLFHISCRGEKVKRFQERKVYVWGRQNVAFWWMWSYAGKKPPGLKSPGTQYLFTKLALRIEAQNTRLLPVVLRKLLLFPSHSNCTTLSTSPHSECSGSPWQRGWRYLLALLTVLVFGLANKPPLGK